MQDIHLLPHVCLCVCACVRACQLHHPSQDRCQRFLVIIGQGICILVYGGVENRSLSLPCARALSFVLVVRSQWA